MLFQYLNLCALLRKEHFSCKQIFEVLDIEEKGIIDKDKFISFFEGIKEFDTFLVLQNIEDAFMLIDEDGSG